MSSVKLLSIALVLPGAIFMLASIVAGLRMRRVVPGVLRAKWMAMTCLLIFFFLGYAFFLVIEVSDLRFPLEFVTSTVFLGGAVFVFLVINLTRGTVAQIAESEKQISVVNQNLRSNNLELEREIAARRYAERQSGARLKQMSTLHAIDLIITSSLDLGVTMKVFLDQVMPQLRVDAGNILLLNPSTQTLEYEIGKGFRTGDIKDSRERLGEGSAGLAALERRLIHISSLDDAPGEFLRGALIEQEAFVAYFAVPLVAKGQVKGVFEVFHRQQFDPEPEWYDFLEALAVQAAIAIDNATMFNALQRSNSELILAYDTTIEGWARALELRDKETEGHTQRVTEMTLRMAKHFEMSSEVLVHIRRGALLHDIGKMGISDSILLKDGPLTDEEKEIMMQHPVFAFEMLSPIAYLRPALDIPYCHHEKWDGSGYPRALKGEQIPLAARIFAVADVWDALRSERRYHAAWSKDKVCEHVQALSGSHFDPKVVEVFHQMDF